MSGPTVSAIGIGREAQPLVTIDGFAADPDALRAASIATPFVPAGNHYPGIRAPLPPDYLARQLPIIAPLVRNIFGLYGDLRVIDASFSIVTTPPSALTEQQRLPHVDAYGAERIALVHYLAPDNADGTAFFRHRSTGYETIDEERARSYVGQLAAEMDLDGATAPQYVFGDTPLFEQTRLVPAHYNRAVLYRSCMLHSGAIPHDAILSDDPAIGRLTITAFLSAGRHP